jgi:hypothetical protein
MRKTIKSETLYVTKEFVTTDEMVN